ncbi:MAG: efflux RND transporter periplasmic adaptor subunit [Colwellia sp.]|nr:efflux RND transporter periplasmic adaptor subunit [Colwellia sp.]
MRLFGFRNMLISFFIALFLVGCGEKKEVFEEVIRPIAWVEVQQSSFNQVRRLSGSVHPVEATNLSFEVGGKVNGVKVKLGARVKRGDELASLDIRNFNLSMQTSQANLQKAHASLSEADNEFKRYAELSKKGLVSKSGFDNAKAAFESATSAVNLAKAQVAISGKDISDSVLLAPYDGKITKRLIEPSMQVSPGQTTFEIEGEDGLEVQLMVPETLIQELAMGSEVDIHYSAFPQLKSKGQITEISSRASTANAFPVTIVISSSIEGIRAGMTAEVDFVFAGVGRTGYTGPTFHLPISALGAGEGQKSYVYVYDENKQIINKRQVQTESIINNRVIVSSGLKNGEIVATAGISFLLDGQSVRLLDRHIQRFN